MSNLDRPKGITFPAQFIIACQIKDPKQLPEFYSPGVCYGPFDTYDEAVRWLDLHTNVRDNFTWCIVSNRFLGK